jgi:hypothetical protein
MSNREDQDLKEKIKEMFPEGTSEQFINNMFHSLRGKQMLWDCFSVNDSKNLTKKFLGGTE